MANPAQRPAGTQAEAHANNGRERWELSVGLAAGISIVRVHDVAEMPEEATMAKAING